MRDADTSETHDRKKAAARVIRKPGAFKVCEGCSSIVGAATVICPACNGYRFDTDPERVKTHARELSNRPRQSVLSSDLS